ncbi:MAG TPA: hypothetical protein VER03_14450 [Bryobacteraceae bacterium]|nr:hypothetical protein [Bryobacteraceae bacterium]
MLRTLALLYTALFASAAAPGSTWDDVAARFGCTSRAHASEQAGGSQFIMEFVPQNQKLGSQERMFTITLVRTSQADAEANQHVDQVIKSMAAHTGRSGAKVVEFNGYNGNHGPTAYFEFVIKGEYNVGVIQRTGPGIIAVQQLATFNGRTPTDADRAAVKAMLGIK